MKKLISTTMLLCCAMTAMANETEIPGTNGVPDLTKGGGLTRINERWIGPLGIKCGFWRPRGQKQEYVRQFLVVEIDKGAPADGVLEVGDVILGADGTGAAKVSLFEGASWPLSLFGDPIAEAEARDPALLKLLVWRPSPKMEAPGKPGKAPSLDDMSALDDVDAGEGNALGDWGAKPKKAHAEEEAAKGKTMTVAVKLEYLGRYSDTAPYNCEKSKNILRKGIKKLYEDNQPDKAGLSVLCLLAADDPTNPDNDKYQARAKEWAHQIEVGGGPWFSGPKLIALSEYYMKTKDESIFPKLVEQAEHHARGVSWFGTTGHKWADKRPDGSPQGPMTGYGPIGACGVQGLAGLSLARRAGVKSPIVESANQAQRIFFGHYAFRGSPSYGEFFYGIGGAAAGDNNAKCAMTALALGMEENQEAKAKYFTTLSTLSSSDDRVYAHGGSFFAQVWNPIGAAQGGGKAANLHFKANRWHLDLKRRWDHRRIYDGSGNDYKDFSWDATGLLFYALPLKQLYVTGRGQKESLTFSDAEFAEILAARDYDASKASNEELMAALSKTLISGLASAELANRIKAKPDAAESAALIDQLVDVAADSKASPGARTTACDALRKFKDRSPEPLASLKNEEIAKMGVDMLKDPTPYVRFGAGRLLENLNPEAIRPYADEIMDAIIATGRPSFPLDEDDPLQAAHSVMGSLLFQHVLGKSLDGVDRKKLILAARSMLETPNSLGRNSAARVLEKLSMEEVLELADVIVYNARYRAPANAMAGTGYMESSRKILAEHLFEEGLPLSLIYGGGSAVKAKIPEKYGRAGFTMQPADQMMEAIGDMMLATAELDANEVIELMQKSPGPENMPKLKTINSVKAAQSALMLPAASTELVVDARNYAFPNEGDTTYTWRKVYGAGKVAFTPNRSGKSKTTTVSFTDQKPGKYRFEVTVSDILGYTEIRKTLDVILYDKNGKLPNNKPPQATSQSLAAVPGLSAKLALSGTDPDGDDLGFVVTQPPAHGKLSGVGGNLSYTADYGFNGTDQFTFEVVDGQDERSTGTITFSVSDQDVGVAAYEGFDYPTGSLHNKEGGSSFGFSGPWHNSRGSHDGYLIEGQAAGNDASLSYSTMPSTGGRFVKGQAHATCSRALDRALLKKLKMLEPGGDMWFSFFFSEMQNRSVTFSAGEETSFGVKILNKNASSGVLATIDGETEGDLDRNAWSRQADLRFPEGPNMVVGRCIWGKTDEEPDTVEVYRVFDAKGYGIVIPQEPVSVVKGVIPQEKINAIVLNASVETPLDEIRVGPTLHSVMVGTTPLGEQ